MLLDALRATDPTVIAAAASTITDAAVRRALAARDGRVAPRRSRPRLVARMPGSAARPFADQDPARLVQEQADRARPPVRRVSRIATFLTDDADVEAVVERGLGVARRNLTPPSGSG